FLRKAQNGHEGALCVLHKCNQRPQSGPTCQDTLPATIENQPEPHRGQNLLHREKDSAMPAQVYQGFAITFIIDLKLFLTLILTVEQLHNGHAVQMLIEKGANARLGGTFTTRRETDTSAKIAGGQGYNRQHS